MIPAPVASANESPALAETGFPLGPPSSSAQPQNCGGNRNPKQETTSSAEQARREGGMRNIRVYIDQTGGVCPRCRNRDAYMRLGPVRYGFCKSCKTVWYAGPGWDDEPEEDWQWAERILEKHEFVKPVPGKGAELRKEWNMEQHMASWRDLEENGISADGHHASMNLLFYDLTDSQRRIAIRILQLQLALDRVGPPEWAKGDGRDCWESGD